MKKLNKPNLLTLFKYILFCGIVQSAFAHGTGNTRNTNSTSATSTTGSESLTLTSNTTPVASISTEYGGTCLELKRDTSSCQTARMLLGLSGNWLKFSCNVQLSLADKSHNSTTTISNAAYVVMTAYDLPDYSSNYFATTGMYDFTTYGNTISGTFYSMYADYITKSPNPNVIGQQNFIVSIPLYPTKNSTPQKMSGGVVGVAINGVAIYDSVAGGTDNIFTEAGSFDQCQGHPAQSSEYHYHSEPYAISYKDSNLIGVMRDGFFAFGRYNYQSNSELDTSNTSSDAYIYGGEVGVNPETGEGPSTFNYHATKQTGCIHQDHGTSYSDNGNTTCSLGTGGTLSSAYFLTGHGNGGIFVQVPQTTVDGAPMIKNVPAIRYYYGSEVGTCSGC